MNSLICVRLLFVLPCFAHSIIVDKWPLEMVHVAEHTWLEFECGPVDDPKVKLAWSFTPLTERAGAVSIEPLTAVDGNSGSPRTFLVEGSTYKIEDVKRRVNEGYFTCTAKDGLEEKPIRTVYLRVEHRPEVSLHKQHGHFYDVRVVHIECKSNSVPAGRMTWLKDGSPIANEQPFINVLGGKANPSLYIVQSTKKVYGQYECRVENSVGVGRQVVEVNESDFSQ